MELISTAKSTHLVAFDTLHSKFKYHHIENESRDFGFLGQRKLLVEVNRTSGFEMLRLKAGQAKTNEIHLVRKMNVSNLNCLGCPKQGVDFLALGLSSGQIGLLNYRTREYITKFSADGVNNGVVFLDFNLVDEYLSAVYENGLINLYGLKTKTKLESLNIDKNSTLARFHTTKRFHLSIASYNGAVYIYDMQAKRKIFKSTDSHGAPCRDLCVSPSTPDILLSVGYDCVLNVFDIRRKLSPRQVRSNHPLSSVCVSDCGNYCVTGNLKGELTSYDLRNLKGSLECNLVHDSGVVRVGFVPNHETSMNVSNFEASGDVLTETQNLPVEESAGRPRRDSFLDFINCQSFRGRDTMMRRDSFNLIGLERKNYDFDSRTSIDGRSSVDAAINMDLKSINDLLPDHLDSDVLTMAAGSKIKSRRSSIECLLSEKRLKSTKIDNLIEEEEVFEEPKSNEKPVNVSKEVLVKKDLDLSLIDQSEVSKENALNVSRKEIHFLMKLPADQNSTPNPPKRFSMNMDTDAKQEGTSTIEMKSVMDEIKNLREEMNNKFKMLEVEMKWNADINKGDIFMQNFNLWKNQMKIAEDTRSMIFSLLRADPFVMEFAALQEENERLKETIKTLREAR